LSEVPFAAKWSAEDFDALTKPLLAVGLPLAPDFAPDWPTFHALTRITTKPTAEIARFTTGLLDAIDRCPPGAPLAIATQPETLWQPDDVVKRRGRLALLRAVREIATRGPTEFRRQFGLPDAWSLDADIALLEGICRFGIAKTPVLAGAVGSEALRDFGPFLADRDRVLQRIRVIAVTNGALRRTVAFWGGPVRRIAFLPWRPSAPPKPKEKLAVKEKPGQAKPKEKPPRAKPEEVSRVQGARGRAPRAVEVAVKPPRPPPPARAHVMFRYEPLPKKIVFVD
jgi:hypothetical protein